MPPPMTYPTRNKTEEARGTPHTHDERDPPQEDTRTTASPHRRNKLHYRQHTSRTNNTALIFSRTLPSPPSLLLPYAPSPLAPATPCNSIIAGIKALFLFWTPPSSFVRRRKKIYALVAAAVVTQRGNTERVDPPHRPTIHSHTRHPTHAEDTLDRQHNTQDTTQAPDGAQTHTAAGALHAR